MRNYKDKYEDTITSYKLLRYTLQHKHNLHCSRLARRLRCPLLRVVVSFPSIFDVFASPSSSLMGVSLFFMSGAALTSLDVALAADLNFPTFVALGILFDICCMYYTSRLDKVIHRTITNGWLQKEIEVPLG